VGVVRALLKAGADVNETNKVRTTCLAHWVAESLYCLF